MKEQNILLDIYKNNLRVGIKEQVESSLRLVDEYLDSQGWWFADFGNYCEGDEEETVGISVKHLDGEIHLSLMKFPGCEKFGDDLIIPANNEQLVKNALNFMISVSRQVSEGIS